MLEGLEAVELNLGELEKGLRMDSELYKRDLVRFERKIRKINHTKLGDEVKLIKKGIFDIKSSCYTEEGIPFVRISNLKNCLIDTDGIIFIPEGENEKNRNTFLVKNDIVLSKTANAAASLVNIPSCNVSQDTVAIKLKSNSKLNSHFTVIYLNTKYGLKQMQRWFTGNIQMHLNLEDCKNNLQIPVYSKNFQEIIKSMFDDSIEKLRTSQLAYTAAETLLLETLGLKDFEPSTDGVNVKSYKESFLAIGRLDAEYYQKKYEEVINHIKAKKHTTLTNLVSIKKSIEPGSDVYSDEGLPFMRVSDFNKLGLSEPDKKLSSAFCSENAALIKKLKPKKETILFSKDGSVGTAYMLRKDEDLITSGAILHLTVKDKSQIIPEYLTLALNSKLVQMQAERDAGGSIILHWRIGEIENVVIPIIDYTKQEKIAALVEESFRLKKQSEQLLEIAKRAVEIAIEQDEEEAMRYIEEQAQRA